MANIAIPGITDTTYDSAVVNFESGLVYGYNAIYSWRIDSVNQFGTTTGDTWSFTSITFDPPISTYESLGGPGPLDGGSEGTDFRWLGTNLINTVKFMIVAKDQSIYYAEIF